VHQVAWKGKGLSFIFQIASEHLSNLWWEWLVRICFYSSSWERNLPHCVLFLAQHLSNSLSLIYINFFPCFTCKPSVIALGQSTAKSNLIIKEISACLACPIAPRFSLNVSLIQLCLRCKNTLPIRFYIYG